ncbi:MAG: hypothetical protein AAGI17_01770 [Planctomycetota bacterium]
MSHDDHGDWFRHEEGEALPQAEHAAHVSSIGLGVTFLGIAFGVTIVILLLVAYFNAYTRTAKVARQEGTALAADQMSYRAAENTKLNGPAQWIDRDAGMIRVPIADAMEQVIEFYDEPERRGALEWNGRTREGVNDIQTAVQTSGGGN